MSSSGTVDLVDSKIDFANDEKKVLSYWDEIDAFQTSLKMSEGKKLFTFYDGPPFATGLPHYGHILAGTIKDVVTRYAHQTGHHVERRFGWDCHGLPVEHEIDKKLNITCSEDVERMGVAAYNEECRSIVMRYSGEWRETITRLGRWIDFDNDYKTMDSTFMESVWWVFKQMWEKDLVYQGFRVMPYSTVCHTPLSNFESGQNYKDVQDPAVVVSFPLVSDEKVSLLAWTTTPWTLPSNLALCVHPNLDYVKIQRPDGKLFIMGKSRLDYVFPEEKKKKKGKAKAAPQYTILEEFKGITLKGLKYVPLFTYFAEEEKKHPVQWSVLTDNYVTADSGTGIVHQAPAFGEDDYRCCLEANVISRGMHIPCPVDDDGRFTAEVTDWVGQHVKAADRSIIQHLVAAGRLISDKQITHSYPHCWRSDSPLIYKAVPSWFVKVPQIKAQLLANNAKTYWVPAVVGEKRFANWLKDARDWNISRNRYWGTPLPIWVSDDGKERVVVGSVEELKQLTGNDDITDLHKHSIDHLTIPSPSGNGVLRRVPEVFDCWFESGSMPYGQKHYPFENKEAFENGFPADFIAEGLDQTRGWFYTLMVISTALFDKPAFKNLIVNGLVCAADGKKMSKRLKNYPDPTEVVNLYGADALRVYLINSPVVRAHKLDFKDTGVSDVVKTLMVPWFHSYRLFCEQARRWGTKTSSAFVYSPAKSAASTNIMDRWILASLQSVIKFVHQEMLAYRLYTVIPALLEFVDSLSKWYIRFQKDCLKGDEGDAACESSLQVFYEVLLNMCVLMAPITPFFTESMYQNLKKVLPAGSASDAASVHFLMFPEADESKCDEAVERSVKALQTVIELGRRARNGTPHSIRIPLPSVTICHRDPAFLEELKALTGLVQSQLNVRQVNFSSDFNSLVTFEPQPDRRVLGKRLLKNMKSAFSQIMAMSQEDLMALEAKGSCTLTCNGQEVTIEASEVNLLCNFNGDSKVYSTATQGECLLMLTRDPDADGIQEGLARDFTSKIQNMRKTASLSSEDKVAVYYSFSGEAPTLTACLAAKATLVQEILRTTVGPHSAMPSSATVYAHLENADVGAETVNIWVVAAE
jgi:isoleucyl-tRNA synthetase